jgi:sulfate adenylyltransferase subunit 1
MIRNAIQAKSIEAHEYSEFELEMNALVRKHFPHWGAKDIAKK